MVNREDVSRPPTRAAGCGSRLPRRSVVIWAVEELRSEKLGVVSGSGEVRASAPRGSLRRQLGEHLRAGERMQRAERGEVAFARERGFQQLVILAPRHLDRAEGPQVIGHELRVEQPKSAGLEARHEVHQCDLGGIARAVEHALAEERAAERNAVEPADELLALVDLETMAMAPFVELAIEHADAPVDPSARAPEARLRAALEHRVEIAVDGDGETVGAHGAGKPCRHVEALERNDTAQLRLDPIERRVVRALRHGKDAAGIGLEQHLRRDFDESGFAVGHARFVRQDGPWLKIRHANAACERCARASAWPRMCFLPPWTSRGLASRNWPLLASGAL